MKTLEIAGRTVEVNTAPMAKKLYDIHIVDESRKAVLSFGMLDAGLCDEVETKIKIAVESKYSPETNELFKSRIKKFVAECMLEITVGVYGHAKHFMIV